MKKIEMTLLNSEELSEIQGGVGVSVPISAGSAVSNICEASGDTIVCGVLGKVRCCLVIEVGCKPQFSSSCMGLKVTINGCNSVTFK